MNKFHKIRLLLANQDWFRVILMVGFATYLVHQIYKKTEMLLAREMGFSEIEADSRQVTFPSITFCPANVAQTLENEIGNITSDYINLPNLGEMLVFIHHKININRY